MRLSLHMTGVIRFPRRSCNGQGATTCCCYQSGSGDVDLRGEQSVITWERT